MREYMLMDNNMAKPFFQILIKTESHRQFEVNTKKSAEFCMKGFLNLWILIIV